MSDCDKKAEELRVLQTQRQKAFEEHQRLSAEIRMREHGPGIIDNDEGKLNRGLDELVAGWNSEEFTQRIEHAMEARQSVRISDGGDQPNNFNQLLKSTDIQTATDYAKLSQLLLGTGQKMDPKAFKFTSERMGRDAIIDLVTRSYGELAGSQQLGLLLATDVAPFVHLVERMTRLRTAAWGFRKALLEDLKELSEFRAGTAEPVTGELKKKIFASYRKAILTERHVDLARSRTGQTLRSLQESVNDQDLQALRTQLEEGADFTISGDVIDDALGITAADIQDGTRFAEIMKAVDDTDNARAAEKIKQITMVIELEGANPKARLEGIDRFNAQAKLGNLLAKDAQLGNINTLFGANGLSNAAMMLVGPYRQLWENYYLQIPAGSSFNREVFSKAHQSTWAGFTQGMGAIKMSAKEVFLDAWREGKTPFAGNVDTYGAGLGRNDQLKAQLQELLDEPYHGGYAANPANWVITRNKIHASIRLWMADKTGSPALMEPALRLMAGTDGVAGLFHHAFQVRNQLEMRARFEGAQLGLDTPKKIEDWVEAEYQKAFYSTEPNEADILAYRRQQKIGSEMADDDIRNLIREQKIGETYGAPTFATPESLAAEQYSREMRFQNRPGELRPDSHRGRLVQGIYDSVQNARSNWVVDFVNPYFQALATGSLMDMNQLGVTPAIDSLSMYFYPNGWTKAQRARVQANWMVAGTIGALFLAADTIPDFILGNGPIDPQERQEWETNLASRGLKSNSIGGLQFMGGIPVLNTLMLMKDIKENFIRGNASKYDQKNALLSALTVLTGQLMRQTSVGQFRMIAELLMDPSKPNAASVATRYAGYLVGGQIPYIGALRDLGRATATNDRSYYKGGETTTRQLQAGQGDLIADSLRALQQFAVGGVPVVAALGRTKAEEDWLGSPINLPWGMRQIEALKHRFFPALWPDDKVYAELDKQNMLNPPKPLMTGELDNVAMSDELQSEWQDYFSHTKGGSVTARFKDEGMNPSLGGSISRNFVLPNGVAKTTGKRIQVVPVAALIEKHVQGKTLLEAMRSLINDPVYRQLEQLPGTSADYAVNDQSPADRAGAPSQLLLKSVRRYYELIASDAVRMSRSPAAAEWQQQRETVMNENETRSVKRLNDVIEAVSPR